MYVLAERWETKRERERERDLKTLFRSQCNDLNIQGNSNSTRTSGILETIEDTTMFELGQSYTFWWRIICRLENWKISYTPGIIRGNPKIDYLVFIFFWDYFNTYEKRTNTFLLPLFRLNKIAFTNFLYMFRFLKTIINFIFLNTVVYFLFSIIHFWPPKCTNVSHLFLRWRFEILSISHTCKRETT